MESIANPNNSGIVKGRYDLTNKTNYKSAKAEGRIRHSSELETSQQIIERHIASPSYGNGPKMKI